MQDYEKLGAFYLGREYDLEARTARDSLVLYDSRDLTTHGVVIGMTGSGKTGLGIAMLEEAGIDGVPAVAIDPKGDLGNLLLGFPGLTGPEFRPWINEDEAARQGLTPDVFAEQQAEAWKSGLAAWGQGGERIARLRDTVDLAIYTPGSRAGLGLSILRSFAAPPPAIRDDHELFAERVSTSVTGLLTLLGLEADPVRSRDHILLSTILGAAWRAGEDVDLGTLIRRVQSPPMARVGVLDLDSFYPPGDRFALAMRVNALLAAPGFSAWLDGADLDVQRLLHTADGKPRISVVSIAHLGDAERMFFVSLLLNEVIAWARRQPGTTSLRALLYMDEVAGYLPPVAAPPSKTGFLTLLKQARAFGLGVLIATQNPGDLDYKALSNLGTWIVGRLQTDRDRSKVLEGLQGALGAAGAFDRPTMDRTLAALGKRVFLLHDVHETAPTVFETRWTMSYLRGPLTRDQIRALTAARQGSSAVSGGAASVGEPVASVPLPPSPSRPAFGAEQSAAVSSSDRPIVSPDVPQVFLPARGSVKRYEPRLIGAAQVQFVDAKLGIDELREVTVLVPFVDAPVAVDFRSAAPTNVGVSDLERDGEPGAEFADLPAAALRGKSYAAWRTQFERWLSQTQSLDLWREPATGVTSRPDETEGAFRVRAQLAAREKRDAEKARLQQKYAPRLASLQERLRRAEERVGREADQASQQRLNTALSVGATVLGALFGRKALSASTLGRATTAARSAGRGAKEARDVVFANENLQTVRRDLAALDDELQAELAAIEARLNPATVSIEKVSIRPRKGNIATRTVALAWIPAVEA